MPYKESTISTTPKDGPQDSSPMLALDNLRMELVAMENSNSPSFLRTCPTKFWILAKLLSVAINDNEKEKMISHEVISREIHFDVWLANRKQ